MSLLNKTILITGAARRLGKSIALAAAQSGADIILHYGNSASEAEQTADQIRALGRKAWPISADLDDLTSISGFFEKVIAFSPLYAVINNASIFEPLSWAETSLDKWTQNMNINLTAPFFLSQAFARHYDLPETGRIINMLDWRALRPGKDHFPYTISKAGLAALTKSLALSLAPRITVNAIALGAILPPVNEEEGIDSNILQHVPLNRWAKIEELGRTALFLLDGPDYITGEIIHLDGGRHLV